MPPSRFARAQREHRPDPKPTALVNHHAPATDKAAETQPTHGTNAADAILNMQAVHGNQSVMRHLVQRWAEPGEGSSEGGPPPGYAQPPAPELSGRAWVDQFPTSVSTADLNDPFKTSMENFLTALSDAGATYQINATYRPPQRAYLMHYAYAIARRGVNPITVPAYSGDGTAPNIDWVHRDAKGKVDRAASRAAAEEMVVAYDMAYTAALRSRHTQGFAIDIDISWSGDLSIKNANGKTVVIKTSPRTGAGNTKLHAVGRTYGVVKHPTDRPHWSTDGN
jgi:hypothetical protein